MYKTILIQQLDAFGAYNLNIYLFVTTKSMIDL